MGTTSKSEYTVPWDEETKWDSIEFWWRRLGHLINLQQVAPYLLDRNGYIEHRLTTNLTCHLMDHYPPLPRIIKQHLTMEMKLDFLQYRARPLAEVMYVLT